MTRIDQTYDLGDEYPDDRYNERGYLNEKGLPKLCRLDFRITNIDELRRASYQLDQLNIKLKDLAFRSPDMPVLARVMHARAAMAECQMLLRGLRPKQAKIAEKYQADVQEQLQVRRHQAATYSGRSLASHWEMDRYIKQGLEIRKSLKTKGE
jgi:hypothetical protein